MEQCTLNINIKSKQFFFFFYVGLSKFLNYFDHKSTSLEYCFKTLVSGWS